MPAEEGSVEDGVRVSLELLGIKEPTTALELLAIKLAKRMDSIVDEKNLAGLSRELRLTLEEVRNQPQRKSDAVGALIDRQ